MHDDFPSKNTPDSPTPSPLARESTIERIPYGLAAERQALLVECRRRGESSDLVWYLEHPPVVTWNPGRGVQHLRVSEEELARQGVELAKTNRGGDVTFHGPGQLIGYPIVDLSDSSPGAAVGCDLHAYLRALEEALIAALAEYGVESGRIRGLTGVWVGEEKVAAIGVRASRWIVSHGFSLNVRGALAPFRDLIVPCGVSDRGVTSLERLLGSQVPTNEQLVTSIHRRLEAALGRSLALTFDSFEVIESSF